MIKKIIEEEIRKIITGENTVIDNDNKTKIVILNRGWVAIGKFARKGDMCKLTDAYIIRQWGTSKGLGQLAIEGEQENTKLDKCSDMDFHILTTVAILDVDESKWK